MIYRLISTFLEQLVLLLKHERILSRALRRCTSLQVRTYLLAMDGYSRTLGFTDPIYAEAYVKIHGFDILLGKLIMTP
jgi:vesicle coat complex subunit